MNMLKDLLLMSLKQKADKIDWEELGSNATFLPLIYLVVMAPGFLILSGFCCFVAAAVGDFPSGLKLGSLLVASSFLLMLIYRMVIRYQFKMKKKLKDELPVEIPRSVMDQLAAPFLVQIKNEQKLFFRED